METLGGFAIAGGLMYGGYSVVAMGAQPGQFFSFLTAFLLAYEPAKATGAAQYRIEQQSDRRSSFWKSSTPRRASRSTTTSRR
jgi:hypothetical protein